MSYRIVFLPAWIGEIEGDIQAADVVIREDVTDEELYEIAKDWNWKLPMKLFVPSDDDVRVKALLEIFDDEYLMGAENFRVYVKNKS